MNGERKKKTEAWPTAYSLSFDPKVKGTVSRDKLGLFSLEIQCTNEFSYCCLHTIDVKPVIRRGRKAHVF